MLLYRCQNSGVDCTMLHCKHSTPRVREHAWSCGRLLIHAVAAAWRVRCHCQMMSWSTHQQAESAAAAAGQSHGEHGPHRAVLQRARYGHITAWQLCGQVCCSSAPTRLPGRLLSTEALCAKAIAACMTYLATICLQAV